MPNLKRSIFVNRFIFMNKFLLQFVGIRSRNMIQQKLYVDSVRLGEHDQRTNPDCQAVNNEDSPKPFQFYFILFHFVCFLLYC